MAARKPSRKGSKKGSRANSRRKLTDWQKFVKANKGQSKSLKQLGVEYRKEKDKKASRKGSKKRYKKNNCVSRGGSEKGCSKGKICDRNTKRCRAPKKRGPKKSSTRKASKKRSKKKIKLGKGEAYCVSCRNKCKVQKAKYTISKKGKRTTYIMKGQCPDGHRVAKIISKTEYDANK